MAAKGHVKVIKDPNSPSGTIDGGTVSGTDTSSGSTTSAGSVGTPTPAPDGSTTVDPSTIIVTITADNTGESLDFNIPYYDALNLNVGDLVRYETVTVNVQGAKTVVPVYMERIPSGVIASINSDKSSGVITERISNKPIAFYQPHLAELKIAIGDNVKYTLIKTANGEVAVNVQEA